MPSHGASEPAHTGGVRGQKGRAFVPPPEEWDYHEGRPAWIGAGGRWAVVVSRGRLRVELPQGWPSPLPRRAGGVAPLEERRPQALLYAAWLKDCSPDTYLEVARQLRFRLDGLPGAEAAAKKKAIRYVRRGRAYAAARGIWPWASWPKGVPPIRRWWLDERSGTWLLLWRYEASRQAALQPALSTAFLTKELVARQAAHVLAVKRSAERGG